MNIKLEKFFYEQHVEIAMDIDAGVYLLGIPFDYGGSGHTRYYLISEADFKAAMNDEQHLQKLEKAGTFLGRGSLYASDFAGDQAEIGKIIAQPSIAPDPSENRAVG